MRIVNDTGIGQHTKLYEEYGGQEFELPARVTAVHIDAAPDEPVTADVTVLCERIDVTADEVRWHGLEDVPLEALRQEIDRREAEFFLAAAGV